MATLTSFRAGGVCSECRSYGRLWVTNTYGSRGATYVIGDDVGDDLGDLAADSYLINPPRPGEPLRSLATWTCATCQRYSYAELVFAGGWLVDLRAVELTSALLGRVHYICTYEAEAIETLLGRSMWEGSALWTEWLPALRAAVARQEAALEVHGEGGFPLGGTLGGGRYTIVEHYLGGGADQLWFARSAAEPAARYLVSTTIDNGFDPATDGPALLHAGSGRITPRFAGAFDLVGDASDQDRRTTVGYVEQVPPGWPLPLTRIDTATYAFRLAAQVAERLLVTPGRLPPGLRPEYVWVSQRAEAPEVTGVGGHNRAFFTAAGRRRDLRTVPLFTRRYLAPEVSRGDAHDDRALTFTLAVMTAEWLLGRYPYEDGDGAYGYNRLCRGEHLPLPTAAAELAPALDPDPSARPDLPTFARLLARLAR
jgi:hypothetical protein